MSSPYQVLCLSSSPPDLVTSAYGPFVLHECETLQALADSLHAHGYEAVLVEFRSDADAERFFNWSGLAHTVLESAVVVVAPEPTASQCVRLLQAGVQDVISRREVSDERVARTLRMAIERRRLEATSKKAFSTDLTTGLPTHAQLLEHMTHLLALREREPAAMALIVLRLEGLRSAEAALGAEAANVLRRKAAVRLRAALRASDVVATLGGDMYAVLLAWMDAQADAPGVASKLLTALRQPFNVAGRDLFVTGTAGIGQYPAHGKDAGALLRRAIGQASNGEAGELGQVRVGAANDG